MSDTFDPMTQFTETIAGDVRDPYPELHALRRRAPVTLDDHPGVGGSPGPILNVRTFEAVSEVLRDDRTFTSEIIRRHIGQVMGSSVLVGLDGEEHRVRRKLVSGAFRAREIERWDADVVGPVVHGLIDRFATRGHADLVAEFTYLYPVHVIATILGLPASDHDAFRERALWIVSFSANPERGFRAAQELRAYFAEVVAAKRAERGDDLISRLIDAELDGQRLSDEEIFSFLLFLLPAGVETTYRSTGNLLSGLLVNPAQLDAVRADRALVPAAIEEALRWEPPMLEIPRWVPAATTFHGVDVPAGTEVSYHIGSANRDETRWDAPDDFDLHRPAQPHLAFGAGVHLCLGMHLARLEMATALNAILDRLPGLRLDPGDRDPHIHGSRFRSPTCLPVRFDPAT